MGLGIDWKTYAERAETLTDICAKEKYATILLASMLPNLGEFLLDRDDPLRTVRAERREHRVYVGVELEDWLYHLAYSCGPGVRGENFGTLLHVLHLLSHDCQYGALAQTVDASVVRLWLQ